MCVCVCVFKGEDGHRCSVCDGGTGVDGSGGGGCGNGVHQGTRSFCGVATRLIQDGGGLGDGRRGTCLRGG
jgi:hypothetical protein